MKAFTYRRVAFTLILLILSGCSPVLANDALDLYFGYRELPAEATGFFRVDRFNDRYFLVTPEGNAFFSIGINSFRPQGTNCPALGYSPYEKNVEEIYGSHEAWLDASVKRLTDWGFNTIGAWSWAPSFKKDIPYTMILHMAHQNWQYGAVGDYFDPRWRDDVFEQAKKEAAPVADDPWLIGYFIDNEMKWAPDWRGETTIFDDYVAMDAGAPGKLALIGLLKTKYVSIDKLNEAIGQELESFDDFANLKKVTGIPKEIKDDFLFMVADSFFRTTSEAIKEYDRNHLLLGVRFHSMGAPEPVVRAAGKYMDVLSMNYYRHGPMEKVLPRSWGSLPIEKFLEKYHEVSGLPILIGEFSFKAKDSGLPNTRCAGMPVYDTQDDRAREFKKYASRAARTPYIIGYHWFEYTDEPALGRFDGEDCNLGLVNEMDEPYEVLINAMKKFHEHIYEFRIKE